MALFNKLFSSRKKSNKHQDIVCSEKFFIFNKEQVRIVLFRDCDFRGDRKLLFDSHSVQKVALSIPTNCVETRAQSRTSPGNETYVEISNGYGYQFIKPYSDIGHLAEMVFGAVAMSYRGTSLKIHSLKSPSRLMCSQIFPTPRHTSRGSNSVPNQSYTCTSLNSSQSLERSIRLDDSGRSSANSISDRLSVNSTGSDTLLVCRALGSYSSPLDVPASNSTETTPVSGNLTPCLIGDSGFSGEQSYNSNSSGLYSLPMCFNISEGGGHSFSCGSLYKRWLRSASTSFEHSINLLTGSASADECLLKSHSRNSKLGLAVVIELPIGQEESFEQFLMEHVAHLESLVWRTRQGAEIAYIRHSNFVSLMFEVAANAVQWLVDLLTGPQLSTHMWISLSPICDKINSINSFKKDNYGIRRTSSSNTLDETFSSSVSSVSLSNSLKSDFGTSCDSTDTLNSNNDFTFINLTKFLKNEWYMFSAKSNCDKNIIAEKCVTELCELLDCIDVKHTNFFVSTLVTAVLTHHLGWVTTVLPPSSNDKEKVSSLHNHCNPLWGQLTDLYGATGRPTKMAQTIVTGTNKVDLISKLLNSLTYFIRCSDAERKCVTRLDISEDNYNVDCIFEQKCCIPSENLKKYMNHVKEMNGATVLNLFKKSCQNNNTQTEDIEMHNLHCFDKPFVNVATPTKTLGLTKSKTNMCLNNVGRKMDHSRIYPCLDDLSLDLSSGLEDASETTTCLDKPDQFELSNSELNDKVRKLCRVPASAVAYYVEPEINPPKKINMEKQKKSAPDLLQEDSVIFVLGENDKLVNLKKDKLNCSTDANLSSDLHDVKKHPTHLNLDNSFSPSTSSKATDFAPYEMNNNIQPSTSWSSLSKHSSNVSNTTDSHKKDFIRSQSVPPQQDKEQPSTETKLKHRYSGVKFNFQQYPQIVTNYMRSKNLELSQLPIEKNMKLNSVGEYSTFDFFMDDSQSEEVETLQTPSNASELEFTSDLVTEKYEIQHAIEKRERKLTKTFVRNTLPNTIIKETCAVEHPLNDGSSNAMFEHNENSPDEDSDCDQIQLNKKMEIIELILPRSQPSVLTVTPVNYTNSLMRGIGERYVSDMVLQGTTAPKCEWETALRKDLSLATRHSLLDQPIDEAVAIIANTDTWEVQLLSSHTYIIDRGTSGIRVGMSQLVSNMLESLLFMWKLHTPPEYCIMHIEQRLQEFCTLSKALAELLLATEFCSMELLTSVLQLEVNDVPLLMAVASTHSPQVTQKYGLSFQ